MNPAVYTLFTRIGHGFMWTLGALIYAVVFIQVGMWHERQICERPLVLHAVRCDVGYCFADDQNHIRTISWIHGEARIK